MKKSELKKIIKDVIRETLAKEQVSPILPHPKGLSATLDDSPSWQQPGADPHIWSKKAKAKPTKKRNLFKKKVGHLEQTDPVIPDVDPEVQGHEGPHTVSRIPKPNQGRPNISPKPKPRLNTGNTMAQQKRRKFLSKGLKK